MLCMKSLKQTEGCINIPQRLILIFKTNINENYFNTTGRGKNV